MNFLKMFSAIAVSTLLTSCLEQKIAAEAPPVCIQPAYVPEEPTPLPNLNLNPLYLEVRNGWSKESSNLSYSYFRLYNTVGGIKSKINVNLSTLNDYKSYECEKDLSTEQFNTLKNNLNTTPICKSVSFPQTDSCSLSMIAPASLYVIDATSGATTINLIPYAFEGSQSFCSQEDVELTENLISSFYDDINLETNCVEQQ